MNQMTFIHVLMSARHVIRGVTSLHAAGTFFFFLCCLSVPTAQSDTRMILLSINITDNLFAQ